MASINVRLLQPKESMIINIELTGENSGSHLKKKIAEKTDHSTSTMKLLCGAKIVNDDDMLEKSVFDGSSTLQCIIIKDADDSPLIPLTSAEISQLLPNLVADFSAKDCESFIKKLRALPRIDKEFGAIYRKAPDPESLAFILHPHLLENALKGGSLQKIITDRPLMGHLLKKLHQLLLDEATPKKRSGHSSYSLDALSDEEMDVEQGSSSGNRGEAAFAPITPAQLAAALAAAGSSNWRGAGPSSGDTTQSGLETPASASTPFNTPGPTSGPSTAGGASPGGSLITSEMFSQALQNALAGGNSTQATTPVGTNVSENRQMENLGESLQLMREMGISDEVMSVQALQATNGDVQAAVNLIFTQMLADD